MTAYLSAVRQPAAAAGGTLGWRVGPPALPVEGGGWLRSRPQGAKAKSCSRCALQVELGQPCRSPHASLHQSLLTQGTDQSAPDVPWGPGGPSPSTHLRPAGPTRGALTL